MRCGSTGQQRAGPARFHCREVARLHAWGRVSDSENPAMKGNQAAGGEPGLDLRLGDAAADKFRAGDHAVGAAGQLRDFSLDRGDPWSPHDH
jgi:hypothetical protein